MGSSGTKITFYVVEKAQHPNGPNAMFVDFILDEERLSKYELDDVNLDTHWIVDEAAPRSCLGMEVRKKVFETKRTTTMTARPDGADGSLHNFVDLRPCIGASSPSAAAGASPGVGGPAVPAEGYPGAPVEGSRSRSPLRTDSAAGLRRAVGADLMEEADHASLTAQRRVLEGELSEARRVLEQRSEEASRQRVALEAERARRQHLQEELEQLLERCARSKGEHEALGIHLQQLQQGNRDLEESLLRARACGKCLEALLRKARDEANFMHAKAMFIDYEAQVKQEEIEALRRGVKERCALLRLIVETLFSPGAIDVLPPGATDSVESVASSAPPPTVPGSPGVDSPVPPTVPDSPPGVDRSGS